MVKSAVYGLPDGGVLKCPGLLYKSISHFLFECLAHSIEEDVHP